MKRKRNLLIALCYSFVRRANLDSSLLEKKLQQASAICCVQIVSPAHCHQTDAPTMFFFGGKQFFELKNDENRNRNRKIAWHATSIEKQRFTCKNTANDRSEIDHNTNDSGLGP